MSSLVVFGIVLRASGVLPFCRPATHERGHQCRKRNQQRRQSYGGVIHRDRCLYLARSFDWCKINREPRRYGLCCLWCGARLWPAVFDRQCIHVREMR